MCDSLVFYLWQITGTLIACLSRGHKAMPELVFGSVLMKELGPVAQAARALE